jgi:hypothetical protein
MRFSPFVFFLCDENAFASSLSPDPRNCQSYKNFDQSTKVKFNAMFPQPNYLTPQEDQLLCLLLEFDSRNALHEDVESVEIVRGIVKILRPALFSRSHDGGGNVIRYYDGQVRRFFDPSHCNIDPNNGKSVVVVDDTLSSIFDKVLINGEADVMRFCRLFNYLHDRKAATEIIQAELRKLLD